MNFETIIDQSFETLNPNSGLRSVSNSWSLSIINDYENGDWRFDTFHKFVWNNIKETALSHREREALIHEGEDSILTEAAKKLRLVTKPDAIGRGSEIAEIVLYGLMKHHFKALPVVPKIFYKQNSQDNAKGADSVHIVVHDDKKFSLWFGESKFYNSIENARLPAVIESVKASLDPDKIRKENSIITNLTDLNGLGGISDDLKEEIIDKLSQENSLDNLKPILNIPILLLYECVITKKNTLYTDKFKKEIADFHKDRCTAYFKKQVELCKDVHLYDQIKFHLILFPVADKTVIENKFVAKAEILRS